MRPRSPEKVVADAFWIGTQSMECGVLADLAIGALRAAGWRLISKPVRTETAETEHSPHGATLHVGQRLQMRGMADCLEITSHQLLHPAQLYDGGAIIDRCWDHVGRKYSHELGKLLGCHS